MVAPLAVPDAARTVATALGYIPPIPVPRTQNPAHPSGAGFAYLGEAVDGRKLG